MNYLVHPAKFVYRYVTMYPIIIIVIIIILIIIIIIIIIILFEFAYLKLIKNIHVLMINIRGLYICT